MASRESQGLQVALILFVMITVALGVTTYIFYDKSVKLDIEREKADKNAQVERKKHEALNAQNLLLKHMIGVSTLSLAEITDLKNELKLKGADDGMDKEVNDIEVKVKAKTDQFNQSENVVAQKWTGAETLLTLPEYLQQIIDNRNNARVTSEDVAKRAGEDRDAKVTAADNKVVVAEAQAKKAGADVLVAQTGYTTAIGDLKKTEGVLQSQIVASDERYKVLEDRYSKDTKSLISQKTNVERLAEDLKDENEKLQQQDFDVPDGHISWVDQKARIVYINLGLSDGLGRQQTFSVYNRDESNHKKAKSKGSIEVTRILERHLAEARILDDDPANPILPKDVIFTPTWAAGRQVHFALAGHMDFIGDDKSDRTLLKSQILLNNGVIDAEVTDDGERVGTMTVHTRYLVLGDRPTDKTGDEADKVRREYGRMIDEAKQNGVESISVQKLLGFMGFKGEAKTTQLGQRGVADSDSGTFKSRTPASSAYDK